MKGNEEEKENNTKLKIQDIQNIKIIEWKKNKRMCGTPQNMIGSLFSNIFISQLNRNNNKTRNSFKKMN